METLFNSNLGPQPKPPSSRRWNGIPSSALFLGFAALLLWSSRGFADYAFTGLFWSETAGTVVLAEPSSQPVIQFTTPSGASHQFTEDYASLCSGRRSFCSIRYFTPGERMTVVYNPDRQGLAFVHDWALYVTVIKFYAEVGLLLLALPALWASLLRALSPRNKPDQAEVEPHSNAPR